MFVSPLDIEASVGVLHRVPVNFMVVGERVMLTVRRQRLSAGVLAIAICREGGGGGRRTLIVSMTASPSVVRALKLLTATLAMGESTLVVV